MKKKLRRRKKKPVISHYIYFYVEFADGRVLEVPVKIENGNYGPRDTLAAQLRDRRGVLTDSQDQRYDLNSMVHYDIFDEKDKR
ncbi:hypothetical protein ACFQ5M_11815 [Agrilactobacillus yilanensis]|uniref:Uncharacterized protein n=1 Tax=Agrilactobacillus yilanensis TaxID=2485997 RepID=A0ABW4JB02_9LACO|nr:hypothetical protein [Agrilactobacillus yilanensis]